MSSAYLSSSLWVYEGNLLAPCDMATKLSAINHIALLEWSELNVQLPGKVLLPQLLVPEQSPQVGLTQPSVAYVNVSRRPHVQR
jgi:hypothetical protein